MHDLFGPIYAKCDDDTIRAAIVENLIEEETGKISGSGPHPELYIRLGEALGSTRQTMRGIKPLPEALSLRTYWVWAAKELPLIEGMAAISIAGEARLPGAALTFARILEEKYGLTHEQSAFWWVHDEADKDHGGGAIRMVAQYARTDEEQRRVREVVDYSLTLLWRFFDGLELAYGAHAQAA